MSTLGRSSLLACVALLGAGVAGARSQAWFLDMGVPGVLAQTFPFLSCVRSCTGLGPDGEFMVDQWTSSARLGVGPSIGDPNEPYGVQIGCGAATVSGIHRIDLRPGLVPSGVATGFGMLAVSGRLLRKFTGGHSRNVQFSPTIALPKDASLACLSYTTQGWCQSSPTGLLTSALRETVGVP